MSDNSIDREINGYPRVGKTTTPRFIPDGGALKPEMMQGCWHNINAGHYIAESTPSGSPTGNAIWVPNIDYKALLEKYVKIVLDEEGWLYVGNSHTKVHLTEEDKKELLRIQEEWRNE